MYIPRAPFFTPDQAWLIKDIFFWAPIIFHLQKRWTLRSCHVHYFSLAIQSYCLCHKFLDDKKNINYNKWNHMIKLIINKMNNLEEKLKHTLSRLGSHRICLNPSTKLEFKINLLLCCKSSIKLSINFCAKTCPASKPSHLNKAVNKFTLNYQIKKNK